MIHSMTSKRPRDMCQEACCHGMISDVLMKTLMSYYRPFGLQAAVHGCLINVLHSALMLHGVHWSIASKQPSVFAI